MPESHRLTREITRSSPIQATGRVIQLRGLFDVPPTDASELHWSVDLPLDAKPWHIGLVVGPSGCGKTTIARELWPEAYVHGFTWNAQRSVVDDFPASLSIKEIATLLSSVGFSSPPSWLRPFHVLSTGEQFRASIARSMAEYRELAVVDEFTSVVDRTVAQVGSAAIAKAVRRREGRLIAVTCHYDVEAWLDPDWVFDPSTGVFTWRELRGRPPIQLKICRVHHSAWSVFARHHYLTAELNKAAICFGGFVEDQIVCFDAWLPFFGRLTHGQGRRDSRTVTLPDFQGVGIGTAVVETIASMWKGLGYRAFSGTGHPGEIAKRLAHPDRWKVRGEGPQRHAADTAAAGSSMARTRAVNRLVLSSEWIGPAMPRIHAEQLLASDGRRL